MPRSGRQLHNENGAARHLATNLSVGSLHILGIVNHTDALSTTTLRCLDHDGKANLGGSLQRLRGIRNGRRLVRGIGETSGLPVVLGTDVLTIPRDAGDASRLSNDGTSNLITKGTHGRTSWTNEFDRRVGLRQHVGKGGILTRMAPTSPHGVNTVKPSELDDERYVGIVVVVGTTRHVDDDITHANVLRIGARNE